MRPDLVNWSNKKSRVVLSHLPRSRRRCSLNGWIGPAMVVQALATLAAIMLLHSPWREVTRLDELAVVIGVSETAIIHPLIEGAVAVVAGVLITVILVTPFAYRASRSWSAGLRQLHMGIRRLTQGAEPKPLVVAGNDEMVYLLAAFNEMTGQLLASRQALVESNQNLERTVEQRTEQLRHATRVAEQANQAKSAFLASMSHEIRTPLHGIIGSLSLLHEEKLDPQQAKLVRTARLSGEALLNLINDILDLSTIEAGQLVLAERPFSLEQLIEEAMAIVSPLANHKRLDLTYVIEHITPTRFIGDPTRLRQMLINLLNNAVKFTDTGSVDVFARTTENGNLYLEVRDTGVGIAPEAIDRLFHEFSQAGNDPNATRGGTGLGLSICRQLVGLMGGRIGVDSAPGCGSRFWIEAPLKADTAVGDDARPTASSPRSLVLVAVSAAVERMIRHYIEPYGHHVSVVADPNTAFEAILTSEQAPVDVIVVRQAACKDADFEAWLSDDALSTKGASPMLVLLAVPEDEARLRENSRTIGDVQVLSLPLTRQAITNLVDRSAPTEERPVSPSQDDPCTTPQKLEGVSVLVIEDNPINQFVTAQVLESLGILPDIVDSGEAALEAIQRKCYDLILMDCLMPGMDGFATTRQIREWEASGTLSGRLPIIALTANVMRTDQQACAEAGLDGCLAKPIDVADLQNVIQRHVAVER